MATLKRYEVVKIDEGGRISRGVSPLIEALADGSRSDADPTYVFDPDSGDVVWANPATEKLAF